MSVSTNAYICFGIKLDEDVDLPWADYEDVDDWWLEVTGFKPTVEVIDEYGFFRDGMDEDGPDVAKYYEEKNAWRKDHPMPIDLVNYCMASSPMYIVAIKEEVIDAWRGDPTEIHPGTLLGSGEQEAVLLNFCRKYQIDIGDEYPKWWLCSYWEQ